MLKQILGLLCCTLLLAGCVETKYKVPFSERVKMLNSQSVNVCSYDSKGKWRCNRGYFSYRPSSRDHQLSLVGEKDRYVLTFKRRYKNDYLGLFQDARNRKPSSAVFFATFENERNIRRLKIRIPQCRSDIVSQTPGVVKGCKAAGPNSIYQYRAKLEEFYRGTQAYTYYYINY